MKLTVKIKKDAFVYELNTIINGDWIDMYTAERTTFTKEDVDTKVIKYISLGVRMQLPAGCEAIVTPRSSTPKNFGVICPNSFGVIDNSYCGNKDVWKFPAMAFKETIIEKNVRLCQFRIQLSQKATVWQKIKYLLSSGFKLEFVDDLENESRGGIGSTGVR